MSANNSKQITDAINDSIGGFIQSITTLVDERRKANDDNDDETETHDDKIAKRAVEQFIKGKKDNKFAGKELDIVKM